MKKFYYIILVFTAIAIINTGCKTGTEVTIEEIVPVTPGGGGQTGTRGFSAKINGTLKKATRVTANMDDDGLVQVKGTFGTFEDATLNISDNGSEGVVKKTYDLGGGALTTYTANMLDVSTYYIGDVGKITITEISANSIAGTFEFTTKSGATGSTGPTVTEGSFSSVLTHNPENL